MGCVGELAKVDGLVLGLAREGVDAQKKEEGNEMLFMNLEMISRIRNTEVAVSPVLTILCLYVLDCWRGKILSLEIILN